MALSDVCTMLHPSWENDCTTAYHYTDEQGFRRTVFHYQFPFPADREMIFMQKYHLLPEQRLAFYQNLALCVQRQVAVANFLSSHGVSSILTYSKVEQDRDEAGVSHIYLETEEVWPVPMKLLNPSITAITAVDLFSRIANILRDIGKAGVVHRGFDLSEVYLNSERKVLLSGFYYSACPQMGVYPGYLPHYPLILPQRFLAGEQGTHGTDIQALSIVAWNIFSGHPYDAMLRRSRMVFPAYATEEIATAIQIGLSGDENECNYFRRRLSDARRALNKTAESQVVIPFRKALLKEYEVREM